VGLGALILLFWFLRRRSKRDEFDGNFDPDRVVSGGRPGAEGFDLAGDITPFTYAPGAGAAPGTGGGYGQGQEMAQHAPSILAGAGVGAGAGRAAGAAGTHRTAPSTAPSAYSQSDPPQSQYADYPAYAAYASSSHDHGGESGYNTTTSMTSPTSPGRTSFSGPGGLPPVSDRHPSPGPSLAMTNGTNEHSNSSSSGAEAAAAGAAGGLLSIPSNKEREARRGQPGGLRVMNDVVQHQDGGRLDVTPEDEEQQAEIPPSYDSIPRERR